MVVIKRPKMKINLIDKIVEIDNEVEREEQHMWSLLLLLLS